MAEIRVGMVGAGGMGSHHAREILRRDDARIVAMCDISEEALDRLTQTIGAAADGVSRYTSLEAMLTHEQLDAVVVTTPHTEHAGHVRACLKAGLHVLVEKPMATTAKDARDFIAWAEDAQKVLAIGYQRHGEGKFIKVRELLQNGAIGDIRLVHVLISQDALDVFRPGASWRADPALSGGGHVMDTGSHINDILFWTTGLEPKRVQAFINQEGTLVDVNTAVVVEFTNGAVGTLAYTSMSPEWREEFTFYGTEGMMRFGAAEPLQVNRKGEDIVLPRTPGRGKPPLQNFIDAIYGKAEVQAPPICGLRVAQLTEAVYASAKSGKPEPVG
ncbi:MAG: Gfo/Idh/MocA family oxidoreductase [Candidatus Latescibacteria bacterium]|nr:Gfo/Idh/MocA family oxidoreductase [Candidatus Latescibacterota bacterium]